MGMRTLREIQDLLRGEKEYLRRRFGVTRIGVFGSCARGDSTESSDIDILIDVEPSIGWHIVDLQEFLEERLGRKVDLVSSRAVRPELRSNVYGDLVEA
jgi:predicted nucleotidyltransferase